MNISTFELFYFYFLILYIFSKYSHNKFQLPTPPSPVARAKIVFPPLNHPLYYRAPAGVSPIFRATLPTSTELISWIETSDYQFFLFFESLIHSNQQKKLFGTGYGRSSGRKIIQFFRYENFRGSLTTYLESVKCTAYSTAHTTT